MNVRQFDFLMIRDSRPLTEWECMCKYHLVNNIMLPCDTLHIERIPDFKNIVDTIDCADRVRFDWLSEHANGVYIDHDCFLKSRFLPSVPDVPYFVRNHEENSIDIFLIYCNGVPDFFKQHFSASVKQNFIDSNVSHEYRKDFYSWPIDLLREISDVGIIPDEVYEHKFLTMRSELKRRAEKMEQRKRHINDIINERLLESDLQRGKERDLILSLRDNLNALTNENAALKNEIADFKNKMQSLLTIKEGEKT